MDALLALFEQLKKTGRVQGHMLGLLHVLIGRKVSLADGTPVARGLGWREVAEWLKKLRWDPELVRELGVQPEELPPRDRQRYWYSAIARAGVDSPAAAAAGDRFSEILRELGYEVSSGSKS